MGTEKNLSLIFKKIPTGLPVPGEHVVVEDRPYDPAAKPTAGGIICENIYASFDPYMRSRMRAPENKSYAPPFELNQPMTAAGVGRVVKSDTADYKEGDLLSGLSIPVQKYAAVTAEMLQSARKIDVSTALSDLRHYIGPLGMPGLTAYSSLYEIGKPKQGEVILISSAAGAVGQLVGHIAKHEGLTVFGSVGSDEKLDFITKELGFDGGFNYKKERPLDAVKRLAPDGIDIYYENVGGEHLEAALETLRKYGRIVACGMISQYNLTEEQRYGVKNLFHIVPKNLIMRGFIVYSPDFGPKWLEEFQKNVRKWIADGTFKPKFSETHGIEAAPEGLVGIFEGKNFGKAVLKI